MLIFQTPNGTFHVLASHIVGFEVDEKDIVTLILESGHLVQVNESRDEIVEALRKTNRNSGWNNRFTVKGNNDEVRQP